MRKILSLILWTAVPGMCLAGPLDLLVKRIAPGKEKHFQFVLEPGKNKRNYFEISANKERIRIKGNSYISVASGLDWYLKNYCGVSYANCDSILQLPDVLPMPQERTYKETYMQIGYTGYDAWQRLFWNWQDWEKEIDRMALSGINVCPVWTGTESVWKEFLSSYNLSDQEINQYLFGTEQAPKSWIKRQENLQKKIIKRMQNLGMCPVYPAFTGTVPETITKGKTNIITLPANTTENISRKEIIISTEDPVFSKMAQKWYGSYEKIYGTTPFYQGSTNGQEFPSDIQKCLLKSVPEANWIIPVDQYIQANTDLRDIDKEKAVLLYSESQTDWKTMNATKLMPWIWTWNATTTPSNPVLSLHKALSQPEQASNNPETASLIQGIGTQTSCSQTSPLSYYLIKNRRWQPEVISLQEETEQFLKMRYGYSTPSAVQAWMRLTDLDQGYEPNQSFLCQKPMMNLIDQTADSITNSSQCSKQISEILTDLLAIQEHCTDNKNYQRDLIRITAMLLEQKSRVLYLQIENDFAERNATQLTQHQKDFMRLIHLADTLRSYDPTLCWSHWMKQADKNQKGKETGGIIWYKSLIRRQEQISGQVPALSGILSEFCAPRWELFFNWMNRKMRPGQIAAPQYQGLDDAWYQQAESESKAVPAPSGIYQIIIDSINL